MTDYSPEAQRAAVIARYVPMSFDPAWEAYAFGQVRRYAKDDHVYGTTLKAEFAAAVQAERERRATSTTEEGSPA